LDNLTGEWARIGFRHKDDLGDYHRKFLTITAFLKTKNRISDNEVKRAFVRGFPNTFWNSVIARLQIKKPDTHPDDPWDVQDVYEATVFVLHGTSSFITKTEPTTSTSSNTTSDQGIKKEEFLSILQQFSQSIVKAIENKSPPTDSPPRRRPCFYDGCDKPGACEKLKDHIEKGLCHRGSEGRIVLPDGNNITRNITGRNLAERVENWNKDNAASKKASSMFFSVSSSAESDHDATPSYTVQQASSKRIDELEREIYELRKRQVMDAVEIPRQTRQQARRQNAEPTTSSKPQPPPKKTTPTPPKETPKEKSPEPAPAPAKPTGPVHPYAAAAENAYLPPHERNFAAKPAKDKEFAYRTTAPIQSAAIVGDVYNKTMKSQCVTLSPEEVMAIAPDVRMKIREQITPKRTQPKPQQATNAYNDVQEPTLPFEDNNPVEILEADMTTAEFFPENNDEPPDGAVIITDPVEQYLHSLPPDEIPKQLIVAKDSHALRSINMKVNFRDTIECILDAGCQIIAMSEAVCHYLRLAYDPTIFLTMESANGSLDRSLGLARNVHCKIGGINLYLQVHVIRKPAYDILLGRPFDVLTQSVVHNYANENQTITIHDPNSSHVYTIPTFARTRPKYKLPPSIPTNPTPPDNGETSDQDFHNSMN
jgi:Periplasmic protein TonB, links inner and outer membranes